MPRPSDAEVLLAVSRSFNNTRRLRNRTHAIQERASMRIGHLERENKRYRRALSRAMVVIGTNMYDNYLCPTPGAGDLTEDIREIHGLVPDMKRITHLAYGIAAGEIPSEALDLHS